MEQHSLLLTAYTGLSKKENVNVKCKNIFLEKFNLSFQFSNFWWYLVDHISSLSAIWGALYSFLATEYYFFFFFFWKKNSTSFEYITIISLNCLILILHQVISLILIYLKLLESSRFLPEIYIQVWNLCSYMSPKKYMECFV